MPRSQGTSRKGKPGKHDRAAGMGNSLTKPQKNKYRPRMDGKNTSGDGGMGQTPGVESIGLGGENTLKTKSVLQMHDLEDFLQQAELAGTEFTSEREGVVVLDETAGAYNYRATTGAPTQYSDDAATSNTSSFKFSELSVPRRPAWDETTTKGQLDAAEKEAFLHWRRGIAQQEERLANSSVTPFEKNLEVWRQLWRVLERSGVLLQLVDARNPLFYLSHDLREYAKALGKPMMVLVNKSDYLTPKQRHEWKEYLIDQGWDHPVFFSAVTEQQKLDEAAQAARKQEYEQDSLKQEIAKEETYGGGDTDEGSDQEDEQDDDEVGLAKDLDAVIAAQESQAVVEGEAVSEPVEATTTTSSSSSNDGVEVLLTRDQLLQTMMAFAEKHNCKPDPRFDDRIQFGMVGFPNVGKSSVINVLVASSKHTHGMVRAGVASQPGKTKHFQTLLLPDVQDMMLCDCPGLVFPSFVSQTADLIAAGVFPIAQMRDHWPVTNLICQRIPRAILNAVYGIQLPVPSQQELRERGLQGTVPPPTAEEFLTTFCIARSMLAAASGVPDYQRAARTIIRDYAIGKLLYCHPPPTVSDADAFGAETVVTALNNTKKLREKLEKVEAVRLEKQDALDDIKEDCENFDTVDEDLLEMIGASVPDQSKLEGRRPGKATKKGKNRRQRKNRGADPYGCHSTPDAALYDIAGSGGIVVSAGKYSKGGYTRPTTYPVSQTSK